MTTDNFCFYLQNRLIQTSQTGGQQYSDTSPFSIPWPNHTRETLLSKLEQEEALVLSDLLGVILWIVILLNVVSPRLWQFHKTFFGVIYEFS